MFTGIIQELGVVRSYLLRGGFGRLEVGYAEEMGVLKPGDSMAVNGVCLTATAVGPGIFSADVSEATRRNSTAGELRAGERVNLERPVTPMQPLGGHIVLGHVDCVGSVRRVVQRTGGVNVTVAVPAQVRDFFVDKGSVAVDGVSLTVGGVGSESFDIFLIPETRERTTLGAARAGMRVNVEVDYLAKLVRKFVGGRQVSPDRLSGLGGSED
jgi:riboflavin synthase